jgi:hypothetical protein
VLCTGQAVVTATRVEISLFDPIANCLPRELEFGRKVVGGATRPRELDDFKPKVRRIRVFSGHGWTFLR